MIKSCQTVVQDIQLVFKETLYLHTHMYIHINMLYVVQIIKKSISCNYTPAQTAQNINNNDVKISLYETQRR